MWTHVGRTTKKTLLDTCGRTTKKTLLDICWKDYKEHVWTKEDLWTHVGRTTEDKEDLTGHMLEGSSLKTLLDICPGKTYDYKEDLTGHCPGRTGRTTK